MSEPRVLVVEHQDDCTVALLGAWLVEAGAALDVRRPYAGDALPDDLSAHDAYVVLGGSMSVHDDHLHDWLASTRQLVRDAVSRRTPTLGICLGHQLVAVALGGEVAPNPRGQQLGLLPVGWTDAAPYDELARGLVGAGVVVQWNDDVVTRAPAGTVVLAETTDGELQAARFAPTVWGVQAHPEVDEPTLSAWAAEDPDRYADGVVEEVLARIAAHREQLDTGWRPLAAQLVQLARAARVADPAPTTP